ncbi:hypothetical protein LF1_16540 [Rubripirellula obstinata]|uniref:Uncharacterized protein n=1 Tax=Rubripirellula obstinata TaxID=406547 RepID=A0A5B1CEZ1_9BACT|nr:hypothetical protein [Rubripirellula obstinata]KAA1259126.1 hypothetical protein LF1_16540 [Rubripirellula obstinata]
MSQNEESLGEHADANPGFFEKPRNINAIIVGLVVLCVLLALADLFYTNPHPHFAIETSFAFQAWFGFVAFASVVFLGRLLRVFVMRSEDYYEQSIDEAVQGSKSPETNKKNRKKAKKGKRR